MPGVLRITNMMKTMRIIHKMPTMNRNTPSDPLAAPILNGMIPPAFPHSEGPRQSEGRYGTARKAKAAGEGMPISPVIMCVV